MKLYATTTSERASKGQGGNEYIKIELKLENQKEVARVLWRVAGNEAILQVWDILEGEIMDRKVYKLKGKSQKGDKVVHKCYIEHTSGQYAGLSIPHYHE